MSAADTAAAGRASSTFVTMSVHGQLCGIPVLKVRDVIASPAMAPIPMAPPEVAGSLNLRGRIVTAIDLRRRLRLPAVFGSRVLVAMLTGMGQDGLAGSQQVVAAGGGVVAQDEASSVVWGMPGAVAKAGLCHAVLPLSTLATTISDAIGIRAA